MQNQRGSVNSGAINENLFKYNVRNYQSIENSDSSDEYEEETHISYQFRRWANHICSVSNNVTNRLRDLFGIHLSSNTTSNHSVEKSCSEDESNTISWTTSSGIIVSSKRIKNGDSDTRYYDEQKENYRRSNPEDNYSRYGQNFYSHMTKGHLTRDGTTNRVEMSPDFNMGYNVGTYPPVLVLPRLHQGVNRQSMDTSSYQSRKHVLRCKNMHDDQYADGWYQHYYYLGKQWGCEESRSGDNRSSLLDRRGIPEKLSSVINDPKTENLGRKAPWTYHEKRRIEPCDYHFKSKKHCRAYVSDFHSKSSRNGNESASPIYDTRRSREKTFAKSWITRNYEDNDGRQNFNHSLESSLPNKVKKPTWDSQLSDITSEEPISMNPSKPLLDMKEQTTLVVHDNMEVSVKDDAKQQKIGSPAHDVTTVKNSKISLDIQAEEKSFEKQNDDLVNGKGIKWSSVTENSVDSLLKSLQERMDTLANVHSLDTGSPSGLIESDRKKETSLKKECIVASCLAGTYLPQCLEKHNKLDFHSVTKKEEIRPSFSDRIQDIWRDGRARVWRSSPRHQTSFSRYNLKSEKDVLQSKLSLLELNQQTVFREYLGECNNAVTLTRILEKLIDSKSRTDVTSSLVSQTPRPPPRFSRKQSKTCIRVNVGVQKSTPMSTTSCQDQVSYSTTTHRLIKKQKSRRSFKRNLKPRVSEIPVETPRPLQVFSGRSIIPISCIQLAPATQPLSNISGFSPLLLDTETSSNYCRNSSGNNEHSIILNNPVLQEENLVSVMDTGIKCSSFYPESRGSPSSKRESSISVKDKCLILRGIESLNEKNINRQFVNEQERILSLVLEKFEQKQQCAQNISQQHLPQHSESIRLQESRVAKSSADPSPGQGISTKDRSWWKTKFPLKRKMASLLKCMSKKHTDDGKNNNSQKRVFEKGRNENVVPIPPVRMRRKFYAGGTKFSKSIQWELSENVPRCIEKIDSCQVTENQQSNKSTSVNSIIRKATMTSGTNTDVKKPHNTNTKLSSKQIRRAPISPEIIHVSEKTCANLSRKLPDSDQTLVESEIVEVAKEKFEPSITDNEPSINDFSLPSKENFESSIVCYQKEKKDSSNLNKFKVPCSLSSKIPLASKPVSFFDASLTVSGRRPSTAAIVENSSSHSIGLDAFLVESEVGKSLGKKCVNQEAKKKTLFKHNRSSLLRANNSMSKKFTMGQSYLSRRMITDNYIEKKSFSKALTSPWSIDEDQSPVKTSLVEKTPSEKPILETQLDNNETIKNDTKLKSLPFVEVNDFLGTRSISSTSEHRTEQTIAEKISSHDFSEVSPLKVEDLTHNKGIFQPRPDVIDPKKSSDNEAKSSLGDGKSIHRNLEDSKNERRSPKASSYSLDTKPCSSHAVKDKETPDLNSELQKIGDNESTIGDSMHLKEEQGSCKTNSTLCNRMNNVKSEKDEKLSTQVEVSEDLNTKSIDFKDEKEEVKLNKICSNLNVCKPQSDTKSFFTENSLVKEQPEGLFTCRVKIDEIKTTLKNEETRFQRPHAFSTANKTEEYLFKHPNMNVRKLVSRNKDINPLERSRRPCLQSKSIPSSRLSPQLGIGKSNVKSARLLSKNIIPPIVAVEKFNSANNRPVKNLSEVSYDVINDSPNPELKTPKSKDPDLIMASKRAKSIPRVAKSTKNSKQKLTKTKMRNKNTEEIFEVVRQVIDVAIDESVNMARKTNLGIVSPNQNNSSSSEKLRTPSSTRKNIRRVTMDEVDEEYYPFCSMNQKKEFGSNLCFQKQPNIWSKKAQLHLSTAKEPKKLSIIVTDENQDGFQGIQSSKKFLIKKEPFERNKTNEIYSLLSIESERESKDESKFVVKRSQTSCGRFDKASYRDNKFETIVVPPKIVTDKNRKELLPFEMENHLMQSVTTLDLSEIVDKSVEKVSSSMLDVYFKSSVEFSKSRPNMSKKKYENLKSLDYIDRNLIRVTNNENNEQRSRDGRNVKINNKVLEEKVKSSIENGVPLKTITITDPSIIKLNCLNKNSQMADKIMRDEDLKQTGLKVPDKPRKKLSNNSQDLFTVVKIKGQCSHTTWDSHKNRDIIVEDKTATGILSKLENVEVDVLKDLPQIIDKKNCSMDQNNLELNLTRLELSKKLKRQRGTLIPRYKKT